MLAEAEQHFVNLDKADSPQLRQIYLAIVLAAERAGYRTRPNMSGPKKAVQIHKDDAQPFSFIVNKDHLTFYLRKPALFENRGLSDEAQRMFPETVKMAPNAGDEVTFYISSVVDTERLVAWLFPTP